MSWDDIKAALDCTQYRPHNGEFNVIPGKQQELHQYISNIIEEEVRFDVHKYKITKRTVSRAMWELILELANKRRKTPDLDIQRTFNQLKKGLYKETIGAELTTYEIAFPLNLLRLGEPGDSFKLSETTITRISRDDWKNHYEHTARGNDSFRRFLNRETPNRLEPDKFGNETFSFWVAKFSSRDPGYAVYAIQNIVRLFISQLNFVHHKQQRELPRPGGERPGYLRWSPLREPFCYLVFDGGKFLYYQATDFDYRRRSLMPTEGINEYIRRLDELPELDAINNREKEGGDIDVRLVDALLAYQDGITTGTPQQSFFSFWRGVENLTHVKPTQPSELVFERAVSIFKMESIGEYVPWYQQEALDKLSERRHRIAHTGPHIRIEESHRTITKRILDKLLLFHFEHYDEFDERDMRTALKRNAKSIDSNIQRHTNNNRENQLIRYLMFRKASHKSDSLYLE